MVVVRETEKSPSSTWCEFRSRTESLFGSLFNRSTCLLDFFPTSAMVVSSSWSSDYLDPKSMNNGFLSPSGQKAEGKPLHLLIVSSTDTSTHIYGADRDWVNLLNALGPERVRVTWAGIHNSEALARYLDPALEIRYLDLAFLPFYELVYDSMYRRRSIRNWAGIIKAQLQSTYRAVKALRPALRGDRPDVVITNTSVVLAGSAYAWAEGLPHIWCVKEFLDPEISDCRKYARLIQKMSDAVVIPSAGIGKVFGGQARVLPDGNDLTAIEDSASNIERSEVLQSLGLPLSQPAVVQIGVLTPAKGQQLTARACARLARPASNLVHFCSWARASKRSRNNYAIALRTHLTAGTQASGSSNSSRRFFLCRRRRHRRASINDT